MEHFRTEDENTVEVLDYTMELLKTNPNVKIRVGTDSQDKGTDTNIVTCICYRWEGAKGVHYIYFKDKVKRFRDMYTRLYDEGMRTLKIAQMFKDTSIELDALEFDFNNIHKTPSTKLISVFKGWSEGEGFNPIFKGLEMYACKAADHKVRGK